MFIFGKIIEGLRQPRTEKNYMLKKTVYFSIERGHL